MQTSLRAAPVHVSSVAFLQAEEELQQQLANRLIAINLIVVPSVSATAVLMLRCLSGEIYCNNHGHRPSATLHPLTRCHQCHLLASPVCLYAMHACC